MIITREAADGLQSLYINSDFVMIINLRIVLVWEQQTLKCFQVLNVSIFKLCNILNYSAAFIIFSWMDC